MPVSFNELRDHSIIDAARERLDHAQARLDAGRAAQATAAAEQKAAFESSKQSILAAATGETIDHQNAASAYAKATSTADFMTSVLYELEKNQAKALEAHHQAEGESWRPVLEEGNAFDFKRLATRMRRDLR